MSDIHDDPALTAAYLEGLAVGRSGKAQGIEPRESSIPGVPERVWRDADKASWNQEYTEGTDSPEYHDAHLAFSRATIVQRAADGRPILDKLLAYTADVVKAEDDRHSGAVPDEHAIERAAQAILATYGQNDGARARRIVRAVLAALEQSK